MQEKLTTNGGERSGARSGAKLAYLLAGILFDAEGEAMTPTHAIQKEVRYRHHRSRGLTADIRAGNERGQRRRLSVGDLEHLAVERIKAFLADAAGVTDAPPPRRRARQI